ncbi:hypothetical protein A2331_04585 [Candidatus Falkowbacteria bacterium RIFOXYB2_FULL_34_18]|uniref:L,D-TPase catalytic domain-containing protein n=1 Tax=Candidatus Falkowbacteria bacterium RIFOXYD2_FULL_34_120 TaxID=1798007 RepID=A0A1F5TM62_9BACT|nr:MAG: hypothetical protein A2331_04585 [Candidatus Falkowbacteria bacterium RIFOXYB2_FULL_34_18]OGF30310.1 MAG: hypothetical protein A2500_06965 [Candidatus Falkowbacteria bacterium RIFOXYC12_FULL_34_55]OGF37860.1 MAG: hypothetical protein A2466_04090 [Candidatus Falkowbacteria bacterium RIFOXYC2_FULL_34_220]OGF39621.1 MAG: hypothetical protein A2515_03805 [Candidatus Falkowbacteria bacterium RIFOXYD12_FULL_34_57]OGF40045.1 MAG: hypothetical protein A2531_07535 [Candidatus Falkowbacteria bact
MKLLKYSLFIIVSFFSFIVSVLAFPEDNLSSLLSGKILLDVDKNGEAWYVYPGDFHRYYLGTPTDAYNVMSNLSLGVSNDDFLKIASTTPDRFRGLILIKPEDDGRVYYVNPTDKSLVYMADGIDALVVMRQFALGITNMDLKTIPMGKIILDNFGKQISRQWQYLGWWGRVNKKYVNVVEEPRSDSKVLGKLYITNTVKVLDIIKSDGFTWYKIDGGRYPGAYIDSFFINVIAQPFPEKKVLIPDSVQNNNYWVDLNISKKVLTLYKYDQDIMSTYVSVGSPQTPTAVGTYNVWLKMEKARMVGAPPIATHAYDLPDVPWVMYYKGSFAVHGTYWHDDFGTQRSAGCTNITQGDAKFIFDLTNPKMENMNLVLSTIDNAGMVVNNHY